MYCSAHVMAADVWRFSQTSVCVCRL